VQHFYGDMALSSEGAKSWEIPCEGMGKWMEIHEGRVGKYGNIHEDHEGNGG